MTIEHEILIHKERLKLYELEVKAYEEKVKKALEPWADKELEPVLDNKMNLIKFWQDNRLWHNHKWGNWVMEKEGLNINVAGYSTGYYYIQTRKCSVCNKIEKESHNIY